MAERSITIPRAALALCRSADEVATVCDLYTRAADDDWRPLRVSLRDVEAWRSVARPAVQRLFAALEARGLIAWQRAGRAIGTITVFDQSNHRAGQPAGQPAGQGAGQQDGRDTPEIVTPKDRVPDSLPANQSGQGAGQTVEDERANAGKEPERNTHALLSDSPSAPLPGASDLLPIGARYALGVGLLPLGAGMAPRDVGALGALARRGVTPEELDALVSWVLESQEEPAVWLRDKAFSLHSLARQERWPVYMRDAIAWDARGRRDARKMSAAEASIEEGRRKLEAWVKGGA